MNHKIKSLTAFVLITLLFSFSHIAFAQSSDPSKKEIKKIAIDAGFGGKDNGPVGCGGKTYGKDINLILAQKLNGKLREIGLAVVMIRDNDSSVPLEERTAIANLNAADLLISLQTNGSDDIKAYGIETYYLNYVSDKTAMSPKANGDLNAIMEDLALNDRLEKSKRLAAAVQKSMTQQLSEKYSHIKDRGIKQAPFYLMIGAQMPTIMIQTSFITNPRECERLLADDYQNDIVGGIAKGIQEFIRQEQK